MPTKIQLATLRFLVVLACTGFINLSYGANKVLTQFGFEDNSISNDGAIYEIWENGKGRVRPQSDIKYSGYYALEISDYSGDHDFPELQGKFNPQSNGKLKFHFSLLTTRGTEALNIALAGPGDFNLNKDGLAVWISVQNGWLIHTTNHIPTKLFQIRDLTWYIFNVIYNIDQGTYDLDIAEEIGNGSPHKTSTKKIISLRNQNAAGGHSKSLVDKISFIGDRGEDTSNAIYYVDDIIVTRGELTITTQSFTQSTPRRSYFLDAWYDLQKKKSVECLPVFSLTEWMIDRQDWQLLNKLGLTEKIKNALLSTKMAEPLPDLPKSLKEKILSINQATLACKELKDGSPQKSLAYFDRALALQPNNMLLRLSRVLSLGKLQRWTLVDQEIDALYSQLMFDPRMDLVLARLAKERKDFSTAVKILQKFDQIFIEDLKNPAVQKLWRGERSPDLIQDLAKKFPTRWQEIQSRPLLAEEYYYTLLWNEQRNQAFTHATHINNEFTQAQVKSFYWLMLAGDAQFYLGENQEALTFYKESLKITPDKFKYGLWGRMADVYYNLGDIENEKVYYNLMLNMRK